jgi:hypothetical protein
LKPPFKEAARIRMGGNHGKTQRFD